MVPLHETADHQRGMHMRRLTFVGVTISLLAPLVAVPAAPAQAASTTARALLGYLRVAAESGSTTYDRSLFRHWIDADGDTCDTREEVLIAESRVTVTAGSGCRVTTGRWYSTYDGATWTYASDVDIDHHVALKEAWESGARVWTATNRKRFANDLGFRGSLNAMTDNLNSSKSDRDPAQWLPPKARCHYAITWVQVKYRWRLTINRAEKDMLASVLSGTCGAREVAIPTRAI